MEIYLGSFLADADEQSREAAFLSSAIFIRARARRDLREISLLSLCRAEESAGVSMMARAELGRNVTLADRGLKDFLQQRDVAPNRHIEEKYARWKVIQAECAEVRLLFLH